MQRKNDVEKAELEAVLSTEVAKSLIVELESRSSQRSVVGEATNHRGTTLQLLATTSWNGSFFTAPPASVGAGEIIRYSHNGSSGAFIFGQQAGTTNPAAYLLAWSFLDSNRRVYVKCGPVSEVHYNGWESAALARLNSSGADSSASHTGTSSSAQARIRDATGSFPLSVVVASFN